MHHPTHPPMFFRSTQKNIIQWFFLLSQWMFNTVCWILLECVLVTSAIAVTNKIADRTTVRKRLFWLTVSEWFQFLLGRHGDRSGSTKQPWDFTGGPGDVRQDRIRSKGDIQRSSLTDLLPTATTSWRFCGLQNTTKVLWSTFHAIMHILSMLLSVVNQKVFSDHWCTVAFQKVGLLQVIG